MRKYKSSVYFFAPELKLVACLALVKGYEMDHHCVLRIGNLLAHASSPTPFHKILQICGDVEAFYHFSFYCGMRPWRNGILLTKKSRAGNQVQPGLPTRVITIALSLFVGYRPQKLRFSRIMRMARHSPRALFDC